MTDDERAAAFIRQILESDLDLYDIEIDPDTRKITFNSDEVYAHLEARAAHVDMTVQQLISNAFSARMVFDGYPLPEE